MDKLIIPKGMVIHVQAIPVELADDTLVLGNRSNFYMDTKKKVRKSILAENWLTLVMSRMRQ